MVSKDKKGKKIDWTAIIMSLIACFFAWSIGSDIWTLKLMSIIVPLIMIYNLIPYVVRLYVGVMKDARKK